MLLRVVLVCLALPMVSCNRQAPPEADPAEQLAEIDVAVYADFRSVMDAVRQHVVVGFGRIRLRDAGGELVVDVLSGHDGPGCPILLRLIGGQVHLGDGADDRLLSHVQLDQHLSLLVAAAEAAGERPVLLLQESIDADLAAGMVLMRMIAEKRIMVVVHVPA